ncbi:hypothetical protein CEK28_00760 [Xenophilus sp. AP218F]|nr:hypothetical protein [Chromobacterium sp. ASV5]OWY40837.1 hypothetical protein CEK28_00760 [Xenophilus sp. AP218F]
MKAVWLGLACLAAAGSVAANEALTPRNVAELVQCASWERYQALQPALFDLAIDQGPGWMRKNEEASALGLYVYDLDQPLRVFGREFRQLALHKQFVAVPLSGEAPVSGLAASQGMARAPTQGQEQYYRFVGQDGPMLSAYWMSSNPLAAWLGDDEQAKMLPFAGCSYTVASEEEFIAAALQSGDRMKKARAGMEKMMREASQSTEDR